MKYTMKRIGLVLTLSAVLAFSFLLLNVIVFNHVDITLDFSLQGRIKHAWGIREVKFIQFLKVFTQFTRKHTFAAQLRKGYMKSS